MGGRLADIVIEATGRPEAVTEGMMLCRDGGMYVVVGQYTDNGNVALNPHHMINRKHLTIKGCWGSDFSHFYRGVQFMAKHASSLPWDLVVSKVFDLHDAADALKAVEKLEVFKALLKPWKNSEHTIPKSYTLKPHDPGILANLLMSTYTLVYFVLYYKIFGCSWLPPLI